MAICVTWLREMWPPSTAGNQVAELPPAQPKNATEAKRKTGTGII
jgi:hypothetical protein